MTRRYWTASLLSIKLSGATQEEITCTGTKLKYYRILNEEKKKLLICQHFLSFAVIAKLWLLFPSPILSCKPHALTQDKVICPVNKACLALRLESQITQVIQAAGR